MKDTAILITTFLRDECLYDCIESIRKFYPDIPVFVGDNGREDIKKKRFCAENDCTLLQLPFDLGVAGVRNEALKLIPQSFKYIVVCEDDIIFTEGTKLETWQKVLEEDKQIGIVGGLLKRDEFTEQHYEAMTWIDKETHHIMRVETPEWLKAGEVRYFLCDIVLNVFMMRRSIWDRVKWDVQFKTAFEHSDFFLRLKYRQDKDENPVFESGLPAPRGRPIKVAYTPDVWMLHVHKGTTVEYQEYRRRPVGYKLFGLKWKIKYSYSSFNKTNPLILDNQEIVYDAKDENLATAIQILESHGCKWWLAAGSCLGAVRNRDFINFDPDIDIGLPAEHIDLWDAFKAEFQDAGFELYKEWEHEGKRMELSFRRNGVKLDIFFFFRKDDFLWHAIFGPDDKGRWGQHMVFIPNVFSASLFDDLQELVFRGKRCFVPSPPERYLMERYGPEWRKPDRGYRYWFDCRAVDRNLFKKEKSVFIGGTWDVFDATCLDTLERAARLGTELIAGVLTDEAMERGGQTPSTPFAQRRRLMESLKVVDRVLALNDADPTEDLKKAEISPDYIVYRNEQGEWHGEGYVRENGGRALLLPYEKEPEIKTEKIAQVEEKAVKVEEKSPLPLKDGVYAIGIKTFLRERTLFDTLDAIERHFPFPYRLYIADDGAISDIKMSRYQELEKKGHQIIRMFPNAGISAGRNAIIKRVREKYVLMMDDDLRLVDNVSVRRMLSVLEADGSIGLVAGVLTNENGSPFGSEDYCRGLKFEYREGFIERWPARTALCKADGAIYRTADQVVNFFLARTEIFRDVKWDENIKVEWEHIDFFLALAKTKWKAAVCFDARAIHARPEDDFEYTSHRRSVISHYFFNKHGINDVLNRFQ